MFAALETSCFPSHRGKVQGARLSGAPGLAWFLVAGARLGRVTRGPEIQKLVVDVRFVAWPP